MVKVAVVYGGLSPEREVSISTGTAVLNGLKQAGVDATGLILDEDQLHKNLDRLSTFDIVFIGYHGGFGEDGHVQSLLEMAKIPFTGSDARSSALAMDKEISKIIFENAGVPVPKGIVTDVARPNRYLMDRIGEFGFPLAVKPNDGGSTIGFTKVEKPQQLEKAMEEALNYDKKIIVEQFIEGVELTVSFLGDRTLPPILIKPNTGIYDYEHKYTKGVTEYICPAPIDNEIADVMATLALKAFKALGCRNYGRVDFRLNNDGGLYCLEANTLPGMTGLSLVPMAADAMGISFPRLLEEIIEDALRYF